MFKCDCYVEDLMKTTKFHATIGLIPHHDNWERHRVMSMAKTAELGRELDLAPKLVRLAPNGTNLGLFKISSSTFRLAPI